MIRSQYPEERNTSWNVNSSRGASICAQKHRSSRSEVFLGKGVLRNFAKFRGKYLCQSLKKRLWYKCFPVNFAKFLRTYFSQNTSGRLLLKIKLLFIHNSEKTTPIYFQIVWYEIPEAVVPRYSVKRYS